MIRVLTTGLSVLQRPLRMKSLPIHLQLEVTNRCNLKCRMCPRTDYVSHPMDMKCADFKKIIDGVKPKKISVAGMGEPFMNPEILAMVRYAKKQKVSINISSNLTRLTFSAAEDMIQSGLDLLQISIDASNRETYQKIRGQDKFDNLIDSVNMLSEAKRRLNSKIPFTRFRLVLQNDNFHEVGHLISLAKETGVDEVFILPLIVFPHELLFHGKEKELLVGDLKKEIVFDELMKAEKLSRQFHIKTNLPVMIRDFKIYWEQYYEKDNKRMDARICMLPWMSVYVMHDGTVKPCGYTYAFKGFDMGNILKDGFENVWNGKRYQLIRSGLRNKERPWQICDACVPDSFYHFNKMSNLVPKLFEGYLKIGFPFGKPRL